MISSICVKCLGPEAYFAQNSFIREMWPGVITTDGGGGGGIKWGEIGGRSAMWSSLPLWMPSILLGFLAAAIAFVHF